ncbi:peptidase M15D vanX D-ala-D-ala dipeptidase [Emticicia oligotrophica DSM 17448]|uniref:D-alanyl-D-alanine dipeptidase n=1 Tax=Emticicia oligotrophica (strain DSM 17448 / CIP 109782 / MTCC 6937 / GPTSA100-15) TaxID=929562 RepID=A0ABM5N418_EMTOG|nr:M15 family metallopeptidase [Emticicia oligotrophica]AFK04187.1 peptidase M15D vanX D-ala-D-ala dipeptidase [Emticicia oligotrophica DSM 17448]
MQRKIVYLTSILVIVILLIEGCQKKKEENTKKIDTLSVKVDSVVKAKPVELSPIEQQMIKQGLVNVQKLDSTIMVELKYSTTDNFVQTDVYGSLTNAYLQQKPAEMLVKASRNLQYKHPNYRLLIYDAARPLSVQHTLWNMLDSIPPAKREDFVASPTITSIHNFGSAVDLTIYDLSTQQALDMGTKYDFFGDLAYPRFEVKLLREGKLTQQQLANRIVLREAMQSAGYMPIESEWWHFNAISRKKAKNIYKIIE